jgi:hypothetical protein
LQVLRAHSLQTGKALGVILDELIDRIDVQAPGEGVAATDLPQGPGAPGAEGALARAARHS